MKNPMQSVASEEADGVLLTVRVKPRASKSRVLAVREAALEVAVAAPPVDGAANRELVQTIADHFDLPRSSVQLVSGASGKNKRLRLRGVRLDYVSARLARAE
jgi:uncharacterized protein (TIGR00251 family)